MIKNLLTNSLKIVVMGTLDGVAIMAAAILYGNGDYLLLAILGISLVLLNFVILSKKAYPLRYILPGLLFLIAMVIMPVCYTVYLSTTNYGTSHLLTKAQAVDNLESQYFLPDGAKSYAYWAFGDDTDLIVILNSDGQLLLGEDDKLTEISTEDARLILKDGEPESFSGCPRLKGNDLYARMDELQKMKFEQDAYIVKLAKVTVFKEYVQRYRYDTESDELIDQETGAIYRPKDGRFVSAEGEELDPGFRINIGLRNLRRIIGDPLISRPFFKIFTWTFEWAFLSVVMTFALGLMLASILNNPDLRFRKLYRTLLIIPYAIPAFISILIWRYAFFDTELGFINSIINSLFDMKLPWLQDPVLAKVTLLIVNLWLGFPYMMIVILGALQSIPSDVYDAAAVDGANRSKQFTHITLPMLMTSVAPLLVSSFAFNFNNFVIIELLTGGGPAIPGAQIAGSTDILLSYMYHLAFGGGASTQYGLAAAIAIVIFLIVAVISAVGFKITGIFEELGENV